MKVISCWVSKSLECIKLTAHSMFHLLLFPYLVRLLPTTINVVPSYSSCGPSNMSYHTSPIYKEPRITEPTNLVTPMLHELLQYHLNVSHLAVPWMPHTKFSEHHPTSRPLNVLPRQCQIIFHTRPRVKSYAPWFPCASKLLYNLNIHLKYKYKA